MSSFLLILFLLNQARNIEYVGSWPFSEAYYISAAKVNEHPRVFMGFYDGIWMVDGRNPQNLNVIADIRYPPTKKIKGLYAKDTLLFSLIEDIENISDIRRILKIYQIGTSSIEFMSSTVLGDALPAFASAERYLLVGWSTWPNSGFQIMDISDLRNPTIVSRCTLSTSGAGSMSIAVKDSYALCCCTAQSPLRIVDISNPSHPIEIDSFPIMGGNLKIRDTLAFLLGHGDTMLYILNVADPRNLSVVSQWRKERNRPASYDIKDNYVFVVSESSYMFILDVSNPSSPVEIGSIELPPWGQVAVIDSTAYILTRGQGHRFVGALLSVDVSNPSSPSIVGELLTPGEGRAMQMKDTFAYHITWNDYKDLGRLYVMDVSEPTLPNPVKCCTLPGMAFKSHKDGDFLFLCFGDSGLYIYKTIEPNSPDLVGRFYIPGCFIRDVFVREGDTLAFVTGDMLRVLNLSDISSIF
ncbi:MAG: hypothetical protein OEZ20_08010, partial [candidate division WOR-3 bacterium]|nr:hypothetical protein [candidate division WOR-3 bacterium]